MKKVILASLIALASASAFAEPTAVLKVQGTLTNAACSPSIGNGGVIDYGYIHLGELSATENNKLGQKQVPVTITCTAPTKVGFTILDNRGDSNAQLPVDIASNTNETEKYFTYGVGNTTEGVKIGDYGMWMTDVTADGNTVDAIANNHDWNPDVWKATDIPRSDAFNTISFAATGTTTPMPITTANFNFVTNLTIRDTTTLAITDDTPLDGQATLTLVYL
ncbi:DUF1120 domain-containing protein [Enterobacter cloacae]|uniref:DUF1120 domain-containing protein n=1 Tax=Enterobacter cloacae TaxID=550 RepID=UPI001232EE48|nr:DUF1120 domain-containing protein [Enterobacter cloacae]EKD5158862.1 DUF1120 domain-containing protein [Enterobacter cloacae]ELQ9012767.1 DUF1120 domain-containing protein [Enterobacter cloacae]KAA5945182.1 DUF1120 domain-containing protein [Enterobacter cloacae]MBW4198061.1 DUF1120 domain-containing protein [Enterobacter cloacae subsp. cloacae]MCK7164048.1 DUF1120 domain-containing protein [Enterobacter cloacae]